MADVENELLDYDEDEQTAEAPGRFALPLTRQYVLCYQFVTL